MAFATPRKPQRTPQDELDGEEVLEITLFAEKKEWIQDKIHFLSTLPPIVVHEPLPPTLSPTTQEELENWWLEHERIEKEIEEFDYGDLNKMRNFAKNKSKQALSRRDTDLIEVCLGTLFAVDKLLSLLRHRRKSLVLLGYRLQWQESISTCSSHYQQLVNEEIPLFLEKAQFKIPSALSTRSREVTQEDSEEPVPLSPTDSSLSLSKSISSSSRRLSALTSSTTSHSSASASSMSRTLRTQTLSLSLTSLKTHLRQLNSTHLPHSSTLLDKLIDTSPEPIPDEFLDEQDRLEERVRGLKGIEGFLEERVKEWVDAEKVFWGCIEREKDSERLRGEVEEGMGKLSVGSVEEEGECERERMRMGGEYERRLDGLEKTLGETRGIMGLLETRPVQTHQLAPQQRQETSQLLRTLEKSLGRSEASYCRAKEAVKRYREGVEVIRRAREVRTRLEDGMRSLREIMKGVEDLGSTSSRAEDGVKCLEKTKEEGEFEKLFDQLYDSKRDQVRDAGRSCKVGFDIVVELGRVGVDPNARRELKALIQGVEGMGKEVEGLQSQERVRRTRLKIARDVVDAVEEGRKRAEEMKDRLMRETERVRWENEKSLDTTTSDDTLEIEGAIIAIRNLVNPRLDLANSELARYPPLLSYLTQLVTSLDLDLNAFMEQRDALRRTQSQSKSIEEFEGELKPLESELDRIIERAEVVIEEKEKGSQEMMEEHKLLNEAVDDLTARLSPLLSDVHLRIPFLSSSTSATSSNIFPFDSIAHDHTVRLYINTLVARVNRVVDEGKAKVRLVEVVGKVKEWDEKALETEREVGAIEGRVGEVEITVDEQENDSETILERLERSVEAVSASLETFSPSLEHLSNSLAFLSPLIDTTSLTEVHQSDRYSRLETLRNSQVIISLRLVELREDIAVIRQKRQATLDSFKKQRDQLDESLSALIVELETLRLEAEEVSEELDTEIDLLEVERINLENSLSLSFSLSPDLSFSTDATLQTIRNRFRSSDDSLAAISDDLASLEITLASIQASDSSLSLAPHQPDLIRSARSKTLESIEDSERRLRSYQVSRNEMEQLLEQRRKEVQERERIRREEEEAERRAGQLRHSRLLLAQSIALPLDEESNASPIIRPSTPPFARTPPPAPPLSVSNKPSPTSSIRFPHSPVEDEFDVFGIIPPSDPFAQSTPVDEPQAVSDLRATAELIQTRDWLDGDSLLRLPNQEESSELSLSVRLLRDTLNNLETNADDSLVWMDLSPIQALVQTKEEEARRIKALATFSAKVEIADNALSDLLDSIDAADPNFPSPSPTTNGSPPLPLSEAIALASDSVTAARLEAIPLVDDSRVEQAIERIEGSWAEMMEIVDDVRPRATSAASSTSSRSSSRTTHSRLATRIPSGQATPSRSQSRSSSTSSTASLPFQHSRPSSRSTTIPSSRTPSLRRSVSRTSSFLSTPSKSTDGDDPLATPRRRIQSGLPVPTPRREPSPLPPMTPTSARPFSFASNSSRKKATSSIPRRTPMSTPRRDNPRSSSTSESVTVSSTMRRLTSQSSTKSSRRDSLASSVSSRRSSHASSSHHRPSISPENISRIGYRSSPPRIKRPYRANLSNKLDREVGTIINALDINVPIEMADGSWSDESGMYKIGEKVYFCRILRSKQVMVRVGGGWLNLLQFIITHFAGAETVNISPTTPVKRTFGTEPQWISSVAVRDQLGASQSSSSLASFLSSSVSSGGDQSEHSSSLSASISMRRSLSSASAASTPLRRSFGGGSNHLSLSPLLSPPISNAVPPKRRPAIPIWRP